MSVFRANLKPIVAAAFATVMYSMPVAAQQATLDELFERLKTADTVEAARIEREIQMQWRQSGSPSMDLLLKRGREAMEDDRPEAAVEHYGALIDHAPDFAEGWHGRATAFFEMGRYGLALGDLEHVLSLNPRHYEAIFGLGVIMEQLDRREQAYDAYSLVLGLHPNHERAAEAIKRLGRRVNGAEL
ncbi:tetratricopeptide repeat protein [Marimonas lutisalis]|uniref:tetratricopeptide repeat protein n=1 Tax=Marimonas lutisalis TaxID=2545756 RepID=UPI001F320AC6|nr:tetratricopeptide repeat protein [Marimonas lutisalis]